MPMRLLVAEDNQDLAEALVAFLERSQFCVDVVHNGQDAFAYAATGAYDAVILDVMMPRMSGFEVVARLREDGAATPVMMLTARGQTGDRIEGFNAGADDYLPKPFSPDELLARLRALLRRPGEYKPTTIVFGDLSLDCTTRLLTCGREGVRLSGREFQILELMMRSPSAPLAAEAIFDRVWGSSGDADISVVWVHVSNLRKALASVGSDVSIVAKRGLGYLLESGA